MKKVKIIVLLIVGLILNACNDTPIIIQEENQEPNEIILIHIKGAVKRPGYYEIKKDYYFKDAIELAGGLLSDADTDQIDMLRQITLSQTINIPFKNKLDDPNINKLININYASIEQLCSLPGIGEAKAQAIINYRQENGNFKDIKEIMLVKGFGEAVFEKIKDFITT